MVEELSRNVASIFKVNDIVNILVILNDAREELNTITREIVLGKLMK